MAATTAYSGINGHITWGADTIEGVVDNGATVTISLTGHAFSANDPVKISGVVGMTDLNGYHKIDSVATNSITITVATAQSYTSGGTVYRTVPITEWTISQSYETKDYTDSSCVSSSVAWAVAVGSGVKKWSGTFAGIFGDGTTRPAKGTSVLYTFLINASDGFYGTARVTGEDVTTQVIDGDVIKVSYTFIGTSTLTEVNP